MATARKDIVSGTVAAITCTIPDPPGAADGAGASSMVVRAIRGCLYAAASAVVSITLKWNDSSQGTNPQFLLLGTVTNGASAAQVPFSFAPLGAGDGFILSNPNNTAVQILAASNGAAQAHTVANSSHVLVDFGYAP